MASRHLGPMPRISGWLSLPLAGLHQQLRRELHRFVDSPYLLLAHTPLWPEPLQLSQRDAGGVLTSPGCP